jgi:soluble lytic murein transglycosylase-like protein
LFPGLRMITVALTAVAAMVTASLAPSHHKDPGHHTVTGPAALSRVTLHDALSSNPKERDEIWEYKKQVALETAAAKATAAAAAQQRKPAAAPPRPPANYGSGPIQDIITKAFSPYGPTAVAWGLRVASCESGFNPRAYNPAGPYYGLFQFLMTTFKATPYGSGDIYDPVANANAAAWKWANGGASAWGCR